jgi:hypothetical protein
VPLSKYSTRLIGLLLIVEAVSVFYLWTINGVGKSDEGVFALFLAIILVALAMISSIYRSFMNEDQLNRPFLIACCVLILLFVYVSLAL